MTELNSKAHIMIVESMFYPNLAEDMGKGAVDALEAIGASYERFEVPGCLEIPSAVLYGITMKQFRPARRRFDGYIALGCVIKGETHHFQVVAEESARGLQSLCTRYAIALGNGIITAYTEEQAMARASLTGDNKGKQAADACIAMIGVKQRLGLFPRED